MSDISKAIPAHAFTTRYDGIARVLTSPISLTAAFDPSRPPNPMPEPFDTTGLWDTGATNSVISAATARALALVPVGAMTVAHAGGSSVHSTYLVNVFLPNGVSIVGVQVSESPSFQNGVGVLIGMDIISKGDFAVTHPGGKTLLSFRMPPLDSIDYVGQINRGKFAGVNRNAPCPCGSGKKYKHCHGMIT